MTSSRGFRVALTVAALTLAAGCNGDSGGDGSASADADVCAGYDSFSASVADMGDVNLESADASELRQRAEKVSDDLDKLEAASDGSFQVAINGLQDVVDSFVKAVDQAADAGAAARARLQTGLDNLEQALRRLGSRIDAACQGG